jgi:hypothetical protein
MTAATEAHTDLLTELRRQAEEIKSDEGYENCRLCVTELEVIAEQIARLEPKVLPAGMKLWRLQTGTGAEEFGTHPDMLRDHIAGMVARSGYAATLDIDLERGEITSKFTGTVFMSFTIEEV